MGDYLVIVESPAKAKTIGKYLGKKYVVKASMGHVIDLPKSQLGIDIEHGFQPKYISVRGKGGILKELKLAAKKVKRIYLAADSDREGEAIAWHIANYLGVNQEENCRVTFNEITKEAIKEAFQHPRKIDLNLVNAQQTRRILDRLVGYKISPLLWKKIKKGLSAGRVQSVAVKIIIDREEEIKNFQPQEYWSVLLTLKVKNKKIEAKFWGYEKEKVELKTKDDVDNLIKQLTNNFVINDIKESERKRNPLPPFTTSTLQQDAANKLNFRTVKTMSIAQQLYEGVDLGKEGTVGLITYMRTDSTRISSFAQQEAKEYILQNFGKEYIPNFFRDYSKKKGAQDAHEAIRPTSVNRNPELIKEFLSKDQYRLYKLIWERFIASQMESAILDTMTIDIISGKAIFRANGSKIRFPGFLAIYKDEKNEDEKFLPPVKIGETLKKENIEIKQHFTQPPPRYTEATLVKTLEELGIGRPSTYAPTIETIQKRGYVILDAKQLVPTELGIIIIKLMAEFFPEIINIEFTANMEQSLDEIEENQENWINILQNFYAGFSKRLEYAEKKMETVELKDEVSDEVCELCGKPMVYKMGKYGKFLACSGFPECKNTKPILKKIGVSCPKCGGDIVERRGKNKKIFYGCNNYPKCDFIIWDKPINRKCPKCGSLLVEKRNKNKIAIKCISCDYEEK